MRRTINTTLVCIDHMSWEGDAVGIQFADSTGNQAAYIRPVYANPLNPRISPVLSLSRFLFLFLEKVTQDRCSKVAANTTVSVPIFRKL